MTVDASLQIRKLPPSHISQLSLILEFSEQWKKLMAVIPNKLEKGNFQCFICCANPAKYNADHIRLIEAASVKYKKTGTEILLDEWGCSGRVLPSVGHLLNLLLKAELYRAADYVSEKILCENVIKRPSLGPAAQISANVNGNIEEELNKINYSSSLINDLKISSFDNNLNLDSEEICCIPQIVVTPDADELRKSPLFDGDESKTDNISQVNSNDNESETAHNSVLDSRSTPVENASKELKEDPYIPEISALHINSKHPDDSLYTLSGLDQSLESTKNVTLDDVGLVQNSSGLNQSENVVSESGNYDNFLPNLSALNLTKDPHSFTDNDEVLIPNITGLIQSEEHSKSEIIPNFSVTNQSFSDISISSGQHIMSEDQVNSFSANLPDISGLIQITSAESHDSTSSNLQESAEISFINETTENTKMTGDNESNFSIPDLNVLISDSSRLTVNTFDSSKSRKCNSPLPNLTLTTHLPHYMYEKLKSSTNDFNEDIFEGCNKMGRLLGSGAFGKVFLATGILQEPVAVKKILLENVEVVDVDDRVTKQFINEVEVLSKFRHKNLVSLLGFSCDGCTYCLLYEYISGGTLKDRLQAKDAKLTMQERLSIALGTADAITYLHTAFSSPLIHRDVKTANILLDETNKPKLGDFGITTLLDKQSMNTTTVIGTSAYMAPEAMRGDISVKCDTFSFGVVLLELLTSLPPFDDNRDGNDLVTHVVETCEDSIAPLLDTSIGSWSSNNINIGDEIFSIACQCIEEKKRRPAMVDVTEMLMIVISKL